MKVEKTHFSVNMSFVYFYLKILICNINMLRIYLVFMELFQWCPVEGQRKGRRWW